MIAYDGHLYVIGGRRADNTWTTTVYFSAIQSDGRLGDWETTIPLPQALAASVTFEWNGYVYVLGSNSSYSTRILEDHSFAQWQITTALPAARYGVRAGVNRGYAYAVGGWESKQTKSTVYYGWLGGLVEPLDCTSGWTRLKAGQYAKVSEDQPSPNRVREAPDIRAKIIYQLYPGSLVRVVEGPVCTDGRVFWKVENSLIPGGAGWTAEGYMEEYYLQPVQ